MSSPNASTPNQSPAAPSPLRLTVDQTLFLCLDIQQKLAAAIPPELLSRMQRNVRILLQGAAALGIQVFVSEQYKRGLGETLPELLSVLPPRSRRFDKLDFSAWAEPTIASAIVESGCSQIVVFGMETHICVYQTVRDLSHVGYRVHVPHDAVCSRDPENMRVGLVLAERAGATVTASETVLFDLLGRAGTTEFKAISSLVK